MQVCLPMSSAPTREVFHAFCITNFRRLCEKGKTWVKKKNKCAQNRKNPWYQQHCFSYFHSSKSKMYCIITLGCARRQNISEKLLEVSGSKGSIVILTRRPLLIQEPVIHRSVHVSGHRSVLGCPQPCSDVHESPHCGLNSTSSMSQRSLKAAPAWCRWLHHLRGLALSRSAARSSHVNVLY